MLTDLVFGRLMYPVDLTGEAEAAYEAWIREEQEEILKYLTDTEDLEKLRAISGRNLWEREALDAAAEYASETGKGGVLSCLMNERHRCFPEKRKKYEL